jgi:hypothetical protein
MERTGELFVHSIVSVAEALAAGGEPLSVAWMSTEQVSTFVQV